MTSSVSCNKGPVSLTVALNSMFYGVNLADATRSRFDGGGCFQLERLEAGHCTYDPVRIRRRLHLFYSLFGFDSHPTAGTTSSISALHTRPSTRLDGLIEGQKILKDQKQTKMA